MTVRRIFTLAAAALVAATLVFSPAAASAVTVHATSAAVVHATSVDTVVEHLGNLSDDANAAADAASSYDIEGTRSAVSDLIDDARVLLRDHRPHRISRASWRDLRTAARLDVRGGQYIVDGIDATDPDTMDLGITLLNQANDEINNASADL